VCGDDADEPGEYAKESVANPLSTTTSGKPPPTVDSLSQIAADTEQSDTGQTPRADLPRAALTEAREIARARPRRGPGRRRERSDTATGERRGGYSGPAPDERDPQPIGRVLAGYVEERGWQLPLAQARVFADWAALVGPDVAGHSTPVALREGELKISAQSTAWATQLRLLAGTILARLVDELGPDVVTKLIITGPVGPSWKHGHFSVRGTRGPRDTYG
jgi:predicted nucleic acid-binding Zn ribbon protein